MNRWLPIAALTVLTLAGGLAAGPREARATAVWSGRTFAFSKAALANPTLAGNQDRITPLVWITRGNTQGIYNIHAENAFVANVSPAGTEWATGDAVNHASLTFQDWESWTVGNPPGTVGVNAVVHLIAEDIYVDIRFDTWGLGVGGGGAFSYHRAVRPPSPAVSATWGRLRTLFR